MATEQEKRSLVGRFVASRAEKLQVLYLSPGGRHAGARQLAALRHAATREPGTVAEVWPIEFEGLPLELVGKGDAPSHGEYAVHGALTLYAMHQQSKNLPMHQGGKEFGLGQAIRRLVCQESVRFSNLEQGQMPRRFAALVTAESYTESLHYARQLIRQLRAADIPLDYALLARQLFDLQSPFAADRVRLSWGRGYASYHPENEAEQQANAGTSN